MILDRLENSARWASIHPGFAKAMSFLRQPGLADLADGKYPIDGDRVWATISQGPARPRSEAKLEAHRKFIDIQLVLAGTDEMGWKSRTPGPQQGDLNPAGEYDAEKDFELFTNPPDAWIPVKPGMFTVFFPEDAHAPMVGSGVLRKVVVKVAV